MDNDLIPLDVIHKEIDLIQANISRMSNNSFFLKGWLISIIAVMLVLIPENIKPCFISIVMLAIVISFWVLDAYFLRIERCYRKLYEWVIKERLAGNREYLYDLNICRFYDKVENIKETMFSSTLVVFYLIPLVLTIVFLYLY